ncbi:hypothetical protein GKZ75_04860 [Kocuria indica]|uniref:Uncharacterized protein n=1 Tax=Kocuria marina subsp. indica TaxID=1049583 RepID=A0A6N9QWG9_9MICC|nr:hypothetical protein [Kocuria indica]NDO77575.1 hypothetical protein [Kocuria indica]
MSTPPEKTRTADPQECPWAVHPATGQQERIAPPAPVIELDTPQHTGAVKPLGPRRLARLQREMAEHARQIQESERTGGGEVDDALLATQRRLADLAMRAAAANEQDRQAAERAAAEPASTAPGNEPSGSSAAGQAPAEGGSAGEAPAATGTCHPAVNPPEPVGEEPEPEYFTITFPPALMAQATGVGLAKSLADPASLPASPVRYGPVTETSRIPVIQAPNRDRAPEGSDETAVDAASSAPDTGTVAAPAEPVRAVDAEGLTLLEPGAYSRGTSTTRVVLALLVAVIVALVVALVIFVL